MSEGRECCRCRFWDRAGSRELMHGLCMHGPPTAVLSDGRWMGVFPRKKEEEWCYQFEREHGGEDDGETGVRAV